MIGDLKARVFHASYFTQPKGRVHVKAPALTQELERLGLLSATLILFTGDKGTGRGAVSELEGVGEMAGEKGRTTHGDEGGGCEPSHLALPFRFLAALLLPVSVPGGSGMRP